MPSRMTAADAFRLKAALAFAAVYLVWGSTYLVIRIGVAELPPALFAGARFLAAGALLALVARLTDQRFPRSVREWRTIAVVGVCMLATANGLVVWGEQWLPSNQAALLVATAALWIAGFGTLGAHGHKLTHRTVLGLVVGFAGTAWLFLPDKGFRFEHLGAQLAVLGSAIAWSAGSMYAKSQRPNTPPLMSAAMQSLVAGAFLTAIGVGAGETARWPSSPTVLWTLAYLVVLGSCVGYAAYIWLLHHVSPAALATYAYVNPAVAVVLGWWILDERLGPAQLIGMVIILIGVVLVSTAPRKPAAESAPRL